MDERKKRLIENLKNETFCKIGVSKVHGIGVIAIKDIPEGTPIFSLCNPLQHTPARDEDIIDLTKEELEEIGHSVLEYAMSYFPRSHVGTYSFPARGLNSMTLAYHLNHSNNPNVIIKAIKNDISGYAAFFTSQEVKTGEELLQNYNHLSSSTLVDQYPFLNRRA